MTWSLFVFTFQQKWVLWWLFHLFRCDSSVKHYPLTWTGTNYKFGHGEFESVEDLLHHFQNKPLIGSESGKVDNNYVLCYFEISLISIETLLITLIYMPLTNCVSWKVWVWKTSRCVLLLHFNNTIIYQSKTGRGITSPE